MGLAAQLIALIQLLIVLRQSKQTVPPIQLAVIQQMALLVSLQQM
jgi:hypothetical protein